MDLTWTFSVDGFMGTRATALGFEGTGSGAVEVGGYELDLTDDLLPPGYTNDLPLTPPPEFSDCTLVVHLTANGPSALQAANVSLEYDGTPLEILSAFKIQNAEIDVIDVVARIHVGAPTAANLTVSVSGISNPNVMSFSLESFWVDNVLDDTPTLYEAGTVDVYESPLVLTVADTHGALLTFASQTGFDWGTLVLTDDNADVTFVSEAQQEDTLYTLASAYWFENCDTSFNCECTTDPNAKTLGDLRRRLLIRAGYAAQASNPPEHVVLQFNDYLQSAQEYIYNRYKAMQTRRFFSWDLEQGIRYYGLYDNANCCPAQLNRYKVEGAWIEDPNGVWTPLKYGIDPSNYTTVDYQGWPWLYEIRECVEVFPEPSGPGYKLWIKGNTNLLPFTVDTDVTTIDAEPVFQWALGLAKSHKQDRDAGLPTPGNETGYYGIAIRLVKELIAGGHVNRRYIPGTPDLPIPTPPVMVQFDA